MSIGKRIKFYRDQTGYIQKELAALVFVADRTIGHYETEKRIPPIDKLESIANILEVEVSDLIQESTKNKEEWYDFLLVNGKRSRKNMDERRFRIIASRCSYNEKIKEIDNELSCDGYIYHKKLSSEVLKLANEHLSFSEIWYVDSNECWKIRGYLAKKHFEINVKVEDNKKEIRFSSDFPMDPEGMFYIEFRTILNAVINWFSSEYPDYTHHYNIDSLLYLKDTTEEKVRNYSIKSGEFSAQIERFILGEEKYSTIDKLLNISKKEWNSIPQFGYVSTYEINLLLNKVKCWLKGPEFISILETLNKDEEKSKEQMLVQDTFLSTKIVKVLKREGYHTLGEVSELTRWQTEAIHGIDEKEIKALEKELKSHGVNFKNE